MTSCAVIIVQLFSCIFHQIPIFLALPAFFFPIGRRIMPVILGGYAVTIDTFVSDRVLRKIDEFNQKALLNSSAKKPYKPIEISEEGLELIEYLSLDCTSAEGVWHSDAEIKIDKNGFVILNGVKTKDFWDGRIYCEKKPLRLKIRNICGDETVWNL